MIWFTSSQTDRILLGPIDLFKEILMKKEHTFQKAVIQKKWSTFQCLSAQTIN